MLVDRDAQQKPPRPPLPAPDAAPYTDLRLCVDGRMLAAEGATGVATYARQLVAALAGAGHAPTILDDASAGRFGAAEPSPVRWRRWLEARVGGAVRLAAEGQRLRARDVFRRAQARFNATGRLLELRAPGPAGVMHWTWAVPARIVGWHNVYTVHDVIPITHPGLTGMAAAPLRARLEAIAAVAGRIVTVSGASRGAIEGVLGLPEGLVVDCGLAVDVTGADPAPPAGLAPGGYYVFCGSDEPRKNLAAIVAGWRASGTARPLAIAGPGQAAAPETGLIALGYLPRSALLALLAGARALIFPTLEEGFGLPVIEAMALGTPVVTSREGALAETAGGAALAVDPRDPGAIAAGIAAIDDDVGEGGRLRADLTRRGLERARDFAPAAFAARLLALYADLAGDSRGGS